MQFSVVPTFLIALWLSSVSWSTEASSPAASDWFDTEFASVRLISATDSTTTQNPSQPLRLGLEFQLKQDWKVYWRSPGDAGYPPRADWSDSRNVRQAEMMWPAPVRFSVLGLETLGYKDEVVFPIAVMPMEPDQPVRLGGKIDYLICSDICIPETLNLAIDLPAGPSVPSSFAHLINKYEVRVPQEGRGNGLSVNTLSFEISSEDDQALIVSASAAQGMPFVSPDVFLEGPQSNPASVGFGKPDITLTPSGTQAILRVPVVGLKDAKAGLPGETFTVTLVDGARTVEFTGSATLVAQTVPTAKEPILIVILALAFLGGLILNLMPCVLPVLSIKILGVINHGGGEARTVRASFMASAGGIVCSFLLLATALSALKGSGAAVGWGIQFQHPWFLVAMTIVITVFACNLWGWFEFRLPGLVGDLATTPEPSGNITGHFMTGMLATLLATPCSAPFLGTAVGFALARGTSEILLIFLTLGVGLATPYLLVAAAPALATRMPRPGAWMNTLRRFLGVLLAGTVVWLLSVLLVQVGSVITGLIFACVVALGFTIFLRSRRVVRHMATLSLSFCLIALALPYVVPQHANQEAKQIVAIDNLWQPFDTQVIGDHVAAGDVVFVDVTAEWCVSCQVNKIFVLARGSVFDQLMSDSVIPMQGDWTLPDQSITTYLSRHGRYGIPFNAVYGPGAPEGIVLPEILTPDTVLDALSRARG